MLKEALGNAGVEAEQLDWLLMHQANIRIMETVAKKLKIPMDKVLFCEVEAIVARFVCEYSLGLPTQIYSLQSCDARRLVFGIQGWTPMNLGIEGFKS